MPETVECRVAVFDVCLGSPAKKAVDLWRSESAGISADHTFPTIRRGRRLTNPKRIVLLRSGEGRSLGSLDEHTCSSVGPGHMRNMAVNVKGS
jgi:hypothetical protein